MNNPETIATFAAFFTMIGYLPQAVKTIRTRDTKGISFWMYFLSLVGVVFWLIFGIMIDNYPIIFKNIAVIILGGIVLWIKIIHIFRDGEGVKDSKLLKTSFMMKLRKIINKS